MKFYLNAQIVAAIVNGLLSSRSVIQLFKIPLQFRLQIIPRPVKSQHTGSEFSKQLTVVKTHTISL